MSLPRKSYGERRRFNESVIDGCPAITVRVAWYLHDALCIAAFHDRRWITPAQQAIADALGCSRRSVIRAFDQLQVRAAFEFRRNTAEIGGMRRKLPWRIAFKAAPNVTSEQAARPERRVRSNVTSVSIAQCDTGVTTNLKDKKASSSLAAQTSGGELAREKVPSANGRSTAAALDVTPALASDGGARAQPAFVSAFLAQFEPGVLCSYPAGDVRKKNRL